MAQRVGSEMLFGSSRILPLLSRRARVSILVLLLLSLSGCALLEKDAEPSPLAEVASKRTEPLTPEETKEVASQVGGNWLYGQGVGNTAVNVGAIAVFPPYAVVAAGNAVLELSGYKPLEVSRALPEEEGKAWEETFDTIASGPGRLAAAIAGKEYRTKESARARLKPILERQANKEDAETVE